MSKRTLLSPWPLAVAFLLTVSPVSAAPVQEAERADLVADEAVDAALALPPGYKRDVVLRAVSRNLRWFGQPEAGTRAARAMTDGGVDEIPPGTTPGPPRFVPLREALPTGNPCDAGLWRRDGGREARTPREREEWARTCLLTRDFHWIGLPPVGVVRAAVEGLPSGRVKADVLAMLINSYGTGDTLRFVQGEINRTNPSLPSDALAKLRAMLAEPPVLYLLGRKDEAIAAAKRSSSFASRAELIRQLVADGDAEAAATIFELLPGTPPEFGNDCFDWFSPIGGLALTTIGNGTAPVSGLAAFLDRLNSSPLFRRVCPNGLDAELAVQHLLAAGRDNAAIARARRGKATPFLLIDALLQVAPIALRQGDRATAKRYAEEAATALPPFDPGDPSDPNRTSTIVVDMSAVAKEPTRNLGERPGDTKRRMEVIRLLAATGAAAEADALARKQPVGALRAVALSAAVAGRAGFRYDDQAPSLESIEANDL